MALLVGYLVLLLVRRRLTLFTVWCLVSFLVVWVVVDGWFWGTMFDLLCLTFVGV